MSFGLKIIGPEFRNMEDRQAFVRIEESLRQYATHVREPILVARNPFLLAIEHFVIAWPHGAGIVGLYEGGGKLTGGVEGQWQEVMRTEHAFREVSLDNPYRTLADAKLRLRHSLDAAIHPESLVSVSAELPPLSAGLDLEACLMSIALFTERIEHDGVAVSDEMFQLVDVETAVSRTMFHQPNLLRTIETKRKCFSMVELEQISEELEQEIAENLGPRTAIAAETPAMRIRKSFQRRSRSNKVRWTILTLLATIAALYVLSRHGRQGEPDTTRDSVIAVTPPPMKVASSTVTIFLPQEVQMFVDAREFSDRSQLDKALARGEGFRLLPDRKIELTLDSAVFATGVYAYFKAENHWRKGKLLQTFKPHDTIRISTYLPPL